MRVLIAACMLLLTLSSGAFAQAGYIYQSSGLEFVSTAPVNAGETVKGLLTLQNGMTGLGDIYVNGWYEDDLFGYWEGIYNNYYYYYDTYSGYWKPGPVGYRYATLEFQGVLLEGWARQFGKVVDYNVFFGRDGVLYKRMNIKRNRRRGTNRRSEVIYSYYLNTETGERSDGGALPYRIISGNAEGAAQLIEQQIFDQEAILKDFIADNPLFPQWQREAYIAPQEVIITTGIPRDGELSLYEMIEGEIGPIVVGRATSDSDAAAVQAGADAPAAGAAASE